MCESHDEADYGCRRSTGSGVEHETGERRSSRSYFPPQLISNLEHDMTCSNCGKRMSSRRENVPYDVRGLSGVTLVDVEVWRCSCCEEYEVVIPQIEDLHRTLARVVARVKRPVEVGHDLAPGFSHGNGDRETVSLSAV
jgi:YgiT-type zinc finger domain-containing protein